MRNGSLLYELGELVSISSGGTPSKSDASFWGGTVPWVSAKDLKRLRISDSIDRLTEAGATNAGLVPAGTVLVLVRGMTLFRRVPIGLATRSLAFNQDIKGLKPKSNVDPEYLAWALAANEPVLMRQVDNAGHGTGRLNTDALLSCPILLPPLTVQRRIAEILRAWDVAIEKSEMLIAAKDAALLGHLGAATRDAIEAPLGNGWVRTSLGDVTDVAIRRVVWDETATYRRITVRRACGGLSLRGDALGSEILTKDMYLVKAKDFVISRRQVIHGAWAMARDGFDNTHVSKEYACLTARPDRLWMPYLDWLSRTPRLKHEASRCSYGVDPEKMVLNLDWLLKTPLVLPRSVDQQRRLAKFLDTAQEEVLLLKRQRDALVRQKRGLMQKLLTGEWQAKFPDSQEAAE